MAIGIQVGVTRRAVLILLFLEAVKVSGYRVFFDGTINSLGLLRYYSPVTIAV
jgi:hypothetical protein